MNQWFENASFPAQIAAIFAYSVTAVAGTIVGFGVAGELALKWQEYKDKKAENEGKQA